MKHRVLLLVNMLISGLLLSSMQAMAADARTKISPFSAECVFSNSSPGIGNCILSNQVPAGKRLVLETVTGAYYGEGSVLGAAYLTIGRIRYVFPWIQNGEGFGSEPLNRRFYGFNHYVQIYIDGPATLPFDTDGGSFMGPGTYGGWYNVSGYLVDLP